MNFCFMLTSPLMLQPRACLFRFVFPDWVVQLGVLYWKEYSKGSDLQAQRVLG